MERRNPQLSVQRFSSPKRSNARIASAPETRGSLGIACLENCDDWAAWIVWRKLFQIELGSLAEIGDCFFNILALADRTNLRTLRYVQVTFFVKHRSESFQRA